MKYILTIIAAVLISAAGYSQSQSIFSINYTMSFGLGETADYISKPSFRGLTFDGRGFVADQVSLGGVFTWTTFYEKIGGASITEGTTTLTGTQYRYINAFPILFTAHYYTSDDAYSTRAYLGAGLGAYKVNQQTNIGTWAITSNYWHFGFAPEVGVLIPVNMDHEINISLKYNYVVKTKNAGDASWIGLNVGYAWGNN